MPAERRAHARFPAVQISFHFFPVFSRFSKSPQVGIFGSPTSVQQDFQ
jgi:hypothetical protein